MKLPRIIRWLVVTMVICFALFFVATKAYYVARITGDSMDWRSRILAGLGGVNCGRVQIGRNPSVATQCALKAAAEDRAFRVTYNIMGYDEEVAGGIVRTPAGRLLALSFYGCPSGCGSLSFLQQRVEIADCPKPYHLYVNPKGRINCFQSALSYPKSIMSANSEPY